MNRTEPAIQIPAGATTLAGFRAWVLADDFPEHWHASYIRGDLSIDLDPEEIETHNKVKTEITFAISDLNREMDLGDFFSRGALVTNESADLSTEPDGTFVTWQSYEAGRVWLTPHQDQPGHYIEVQGTPDWVLEVVSENSVAKDTRSLRATYHRAGIPEYWIIDARFDAIEFQILRYRRDRYVAVSPRGGWLRSRVFDRGFRLERRRNRLGQWAYALQMTPD